MITLPASYSTGLSSGYELCYFVIINLSGGTNRVILSTSSKPVTTNPLTYNGVAISATTDNYKPEWLGSIIIESGSTRSINALSECDFALNIKTGGGVAPVNECTITLLNQGLFSDFVSQFDIEYEAIEIWEGYIPADEEETIEIETDCILRFAGIVSESGRWDYSTYTIPLIDRRALDTTSLPRQKITRETYPLAPENSINEPIPILLGDFSSGWDALNSNSAKAIPINVNSQSFIVCGHRWKAPADLLLNVSYDKAFFYDSNLPPGEIVSDVHNTQQSTPHVITLGKALTGRSTVRVGDRIEVLGSFNIVPKLIGVARKRNTYGKLTLEDCEAAVDNNLDTYVTIPANTEMWLGFEERRMPGEIYSYNVVLTVIAGNIAGEPAVWISRKSTGYEWDAAPVMEETSISFDLNYDWTLGTGKEDWRQLWDLEVGILTGDGEQCDIYAVYLTIESKVYELTATPGKSRRPLVPGRANVHMPVRRPLLTKVTPAESVDTKLICRTQGYTYGEWINGRHSLEAGRLIENPAHIIELILREELGIEETAINTSSFDSVYTARAGWKLAAQLLSERNVFDVLEQICYEFFLTLVLEANTTTGKEQYKLIAIDDASVSYTITSADILIADAPQINVAKSPVDNIYNSFIYGYKVNNQTLEYDETIYIADDDGDNMATTNIATNAGAPRTGNYTTWCDESANRYKRRSILSSNFDFIRDAVTAELAIKKFAEWFAFRRLIVNMSVLKNASTLRLQRGDVIKITSPLLGSVHSNATHFIITGINYPAVGTTIAPYIIITCEELPNANTGAQLFTTLSPHMKIN